MPHPSSGASLPSPSEKTAEALTSHGQRSHLPHRRRESQVPCSLLRALVNEVWYVWPSCQLASCKWTLPFRRSSNHSPAVQMSHHAQSATRTAPLCPHPATLSYLQA